MSVLKIDGHFYVIIKSMTRETLKIAFWILLALTILITGAVVFTMVAREEARAKKKTK
ncbi:MAG: hypothetical protein IKZ78_05535 [Firmicutes bacterium]|nr:hypothetical protein [Bacillota bacterium]